MPIVFNRVFAYCKSHKVPLLNIDHRKALGNIIAEAYFKSGIKKHLNRVDKHEPEGNFKVLYYPKEFAQEMDKIISDYCLSNSLDKLDKSKFKKRKRIKNEKYLK